MDRSLRRHTLGDLLRWSAARVPQKTAIECGDVRWTYAELDSISNRVARGLARQGIAYGDRIALLARNSAAFVAMRFALARLGAVMVPINFMLREPDVAFILRHSGARLLLTDLEFRAIGEGAARLDTAVEGSLLLPDEQGQALPEGSACFDDLLDGDDAPLRTEVDAASIAQILYTSGTESLPKGVVLAHAAVIAEYVSSLVDAELAAGDTMLHAMPLYHCAALDVFLGPSLYLGASNVLTAHPTPEHLLGLIARHRIDSFFVPPTVWIALLRSPAFDRHDLSCLRKCYYGASIMPVEVLKELLARLPQARIWGLYGQTEMAGVVTVLRPDEQERKAGSIGRPMLNVETRLVDDEGRDVGVGIIGEIVHRSPQVLEGYYRDETRTREAFRGGWFHSGDLATCDAEGYLTIVDRKKDIIKSGGENVSSREVEEVLYAHPAIAEVAVIGLPHARWIEAVVAVVVVRVGQVASQESLVEHCRTRLAHFKVPKGIIFVENLPKNPSGKLLKRELRQRYANWSA